VFEDFFSIHAIFQNSGVENPLFETLRLFDLLSNGKIREALSLCDKESVDVANIAHERKNGVPMEYILGSATFMGRSFFCTKNTLIPTEETSLLVTTAYDFIKTRLQSGLGVQTVIEIGTGCGNIAISLALLCDRNVKILASDVSPSAVEIARKNVLKFNAQESILLFSGDLFEPFNEYQGASDVIICNPPYIPTTSLKKLSAEIIDHEPIVALDGGPYGITFFRRLINGALTVLKQEGVLVFEIGEGQEKMISRLFEKNPAYKEIQYYKYGDNVRVISAVKKSGVSA